MPASLDASLLHDAPGIRVTGTDQEIKESADWSRCLGPGRAHLVLNLDGHAVILGRCIRLGIVPASASLLRTQDGEIVHASRLPVGGRHRLVVISATPGWLASHFGASASALHPALRDAATDRPDPLGHLRSMNLAERDLCESLLQPPVPRALRPAWFTGKCLECFSLFGSTPRPGASGQDPLRQRIDAATLWLREHFRDDLDLHSVARHVGCAPHYLSRLFKQHSGKTLSQKLREIRIDRAAVLLRDGSCNVTEAAFEVGYNSLSHFTKAFVAEKGIRPSDWRGA
jgi:AraC-like DNA-binding protein